jgi:hypothetical protein
MLLIDAIEGLAHEAQRAQCCERIASNTDSNEDIVRKLVKLDGGDRLNGGEILFQPRCLWGRLLLGDDMFGNTGVLRLSCLVRKVVAPA